MSGPSFSTRRISERQSRKSRNQKPTFGFMKIFFIIVILLFVWTVYYISSTKNIIIPAKNYTIDTGVTLTNFNEKENLDISSWRYHMYVKFFAPKVSFRAGYYVVKDDMPLEDLLQKGFQKTSPTGIEMSLTFLPGWNIWDIDAYLTKKNVITSGEFVKNATENFKKYQENFAFLKGAKSLEGFLYPDTYRFYKNASADDITKTLLREFQKKIGKSYEKMPEKQAYETLILASIIEREERSDKNRPIVAGILAKRVKENIPMGADATVCYGFQKTHKECTPKFIGSVITDHDNKYNTRKNLGYPPTPISSISLSSWEAAENPQDSDYYYYLHGNDGAIRYGKTLQEHNTNKKKYLQ